MGLPTSGGRAEASLTAWAPRPRTRGSRVRPPDRRLHATNPGPTFANKVSRETRALGANPHPPRGDPQSWGQRGGRRGEGGGGRRGGESCASRFHPPGARPPPPSSVQRASPHPPHPRERALSRGRGYPRIRSTEVASGPPALPISLPLLGVPSGRARSPSRARCGAPGALHPGPPRTEPGAGGGRARLLPGLAAGVAHRRSPPSARRHLEVWL